EIHIRNPQRQHVIIVGLEHPFHLIPFHRVCVFAVDERFKFVHAVYPLNEKLTILYMIRKSARKKKAKHMSALLTGGIRESLTLTIIPIIHKIKQRNLHFLHIFYFFLKNHAYSFIICYK